jgi:hypothetical protein
VIKRRRDLSLRTAALPLFFPGRTGSSQCSQSWDGGEATPASLSVSTTLPMLCEGMGHGNGLGGRRQSRHARDPLAALLSVALAQRSRGILRFANGNGLTARLVLTRIPELHLWQTFLNFEGSRDTLASLFLLRDLRAAKATVGSGFHTKQSQTERTLLVGSFKCVHGC